MNHEDYFEEFHKNELSRYQVDQDGRRKYLQKGYLHLDYRIWYPDFSEKFKKFVTVPDNVAQMRFKPLLHVTLESRRFRPDKDSGKRRIEIKPRPISYAGHFDALVYSFYNIVLSNFYEQFVQANGLDSCVLAYRKLGRNNVHFAKDVFTHIKERGECVALAIDVKGFFDHLDHHILKEAWLELLHINPDFKETLLPDHHYKIFRSLTRYAYICKECIMITLGYKEKDLRYLQCLCDDSEFKKVRSHIQVNKEPFGIPQGTPLSAVLSNVYMASFDKAMCKRAHEEGWLYRRYCDDILVVCEPGELSDAERLIRQLLDELKLKINDDKTDRVQFKFTDSGKLRGYKGTDLNIFKNLQYLGLEFSGERIYVRSASVSRYYRRMKASVSEAAKRTLGRNSKGGVLGRKKLNSRYLDRRERNFPNYALRASRIVDEENLTNSIKKQLRNSCNTLKKTIKKKKIDRANYLLRKRGN